MRDGNACHRGAVRKDAAVEYGHAIGDDDALQRGAAGKSTASDLFHGIGDVDLLQRSTIQEYAVTQRIQLTWQDNALQEFATSELTVDEFQNLVEKNKGNLSKNV